MKEDQKIWIHSKINAELTNRDKIKGTLADLLKEAEEVIGLSGPNTISIDNVKSMATKPTKEEIELIEKETELEKIRKRKTINWIIYWKKKTTKRN